MTAPHPTALARDAVRATALVTVVVLATAGSHPLLDLLLAAVPGVAGVLVGLVGVTELLRRAGAGRAVSWAQRVPAAAFGALTGIAVAAPAHAAFGHAPTGVAGLLGSALSAAPVALLAAAVLFVPAPVAREWHRGARVARRALVVALVVTLPGVVSGTALAGPAVAASSAVAPDTGGAVCPAGARTVLYDLAAISLDIPLNGWGDHLPDGMMYALKAQVPALRANPQLAQPLVVRAAVGDCVKIAMRNDVSGHRVGIHPDGLVQFDPAGSDGARVGGNPDTTLGTGEERTYTWYADHEGEAPIVDIANLDSTVDDGTTVQHGLFGAVLVHPRGSTWHDQVTGADMLGAGGVVESNVAADVHVPGGVGFRSFAAVIMDEIEGVRDATGQEPTYPTTGQADSTFGINYRSEPLRNRLRAILDHRAGKTITLPNGTTYAPTDHFCDGFVPELGRIVDDPGAKCMSEESHLQSWVFGDEGKLTHRDPATGAVVVDTDVAIAKAYRGDPLHFSLIHPGAKETHPWHQHTQRWFADPTNTLSPRKDVQSLGPGEAFSLVIEGGAGGLAGAVGDSIFHCHLYPHFAQGFWGHERIFDRLRDGTQRYADGTPIQALQPLPDRPGAVPAPDALHPGFPLFVKGDVGQRAYRIPNAVVRDDFAAIRRPGDTIRGPNALEAANLPALDKAKPGVGVIDPCPAGVPVRTYRPHAVDLPIVYNKAGWTDKQGRIYVEESHEKAVLAGTEAPVPYTIRSRQGECVQVLTSNDLHLDEDPTVPLDHVNRLDGSYQMTDETSEISTHVHLVRFDELGSDGTSVGWNYVQAAMPGQTYGYRWFVDQPLRTVFFHDHQYANLHQQKGLFAAMNVEPADATWTDPATGKATDGTGPMADIHSALGAHFREFTLFYSDRIPMWKDGGRGEPINPPENIGQFGADQGGYAINYRNEPFPTRTQPGLPGAKGDPAYVYSSAVWGDPSTPLLRAYTGDPVVIRQVTGAHEEVHDFTLHGHRWLNEPDNPASTVTDVQGSALAEYFNYEIQAGVPRKKLKNAANKRAETAVGAANGGPSLVVNGAGQPGDYLYGSTALDDQWLGMWGIFRTADKAVPGLVPLPDRKAPKAGVPWPAQQPGQALADAKARNTCPTTAPVRAVDVVAANVPIVYNPRTGDNDPDGLVYVLAADEAATKAGTRPVTPLVLRANAGECLKITLANHLPTTGPPRHGDEVAVPADAPFPRGSRVSLHAGLVDGDVTTSDGTTVGYNFDQTVPPSTKAKNNTTTMFWFVPPDVGTASIPLVDFGDRRGHRHHGLFGALLVEPPGSTWTDPATGGPASGVAADIHFTENGAPVAAREFAAIWQDGFTLRDRAGAVLPLALPPGHTATDLDPYERGHRGINYRTERFAARALTDSEPANLMSSAVHGDPATPVFRAYAGDRTWLRVLQGADRGRAHTVVVSGHGWHYQGSDATSTIRSAAGMLLPETGWTFDLVGGAGGPARRPGDYLVRDGLMHNQVNAGLWFLLRVEPAVRPDLRPLS